MFLLILRSSGLKHTYLSHSIRIFLIEIYYLDKPLLPKIKFQRWTKECHHKIQWKRDNMLIGNLGRFKPLDPLICVYHINFGSYLDRGNDTHRKWSPLVSLQNNCLILLQTSSGYWNLVIQNVRVSIDLELWFIFWQAKLIQNWENLIIILFHHI